MAIKKDTLDDLLAGRDPKAVFSKDGLFDELKKALAERGLNAELDDHLDNEAAEGSQNRRNGSSKKTVLTETAKIDIRIPRDREGTFDPKLIQRYQRRFPGFDDKIVSMYARGMTVREIQGHLLELYGLEVSPDLISTVTDAVLETVAEWQNRPLETSYPLVFFDAIRVKIRDEGLVRNKAVYLALGVAADGTKDILGLWIETTEGAKFWLFAFAPAVRKIVYTTNAIEALNATLRRAVRARGHFPSDEAATKLIFLVLRQVAQQWKMPPREWAEAKTQFAIMFGDRFVRT